MIFSTETIDLNGVELVKARGRLLTLTTRRNEKLTLDLAAADEDVLKILKLAISQEQRARKDRAAIQRKLDQEARSAKKLKLAAE